MDYISQANVGGTTYGLGLPNVYINSKGNFNIETSAEIGNTPADKGKINIEANSDIQFKPGDDIILYSHHREEGKLDEVAVKVTDGDDVPVKLQLNAAEMTISTKDKTGDDANVFDVNINSGKNTKGYLKVRAQAIDLRCEEHGGIALQPKGSDGQGNMNKIKFEHGGGDGLEFGTFNTEKTSIFTNEYRFNKDGVWKMATRVTKASDKADANDATTALKYVKQADDFYDVIDPTDEQTTTRDIVQTAYALNTKDGIHTKITNKGNLEIAAVSKVKITAIHTNIRQGSSTGTYTEQGAVEGDELYNFILGDLVTYFQPTGYTTSADIYSGLQVGDTVSLSLLATDSGLSVEAITNGIKNAGIEGFALGLEDNELNFTPEEVYEFEIIQPNINIESENNIVLDAEGKLELKGALDFGSTFSFGETEGGISAIIKKTAKNKTKDCEIIQVIAVNNGSSALTVPSIWDPTANDNAGANQSETTVSVPAGSSQVIAQCSLYDVIKLVNYMKDNTSGPWAAQQ